ncbi:AI-2E family transporter [Phytomonospora endophytica]|uniref:Putative PurR-regulated permease PerM n=1 Tax=Phytomonospora endophytica TaxID=714109 RepID=A0A841FZC6_9ACTN|nr:AI-2E family transporter [Phytomonospora endophytica]MBB6038717.1 putative PurR-regulated permease PerM [Phytomonospora endophytica]GIG68486.1 AI-2E family transporter [Phytomonospora endophytica]
MARTPEGPATPAIPATGPEAAPVPGRVDRALLAAAAIVVITAGLKLAAGLVAPVALALVLVVALKPVQNRLVRLGWPRWLGTAVLLLVLYGILAAGAMIFVISVGRLAALVPQYAARADELLASLQERLTTWGVDTGAVKAMVGSLDPGHLVDLLSALAGSLLGLLTNLLFLLSLLLFMGMEAAGFGARLERVGAARPDLVAALRGFARGTRKYLIVSTIFGLIVAALDGVALWALGVPLPLLWALLSFITNYIPNVGFILGLVPPALLGLLDGGVGTMLWVVAVYCVINFVLQSLVQPKVIGNSVDISVTLTFLALVFWAWILGGIGAVLAVPLTLLVKALLVDTSPGTRWANQLLSAKPPKA